MPNDLQPFVDKTSTPFVHFVTNEAWIAEIKSRNEDPTAEEYQKQRLLLLTIDKPISHPTVPSSVPVAVRCLPDNVGQTFLSFPFRDTAKRINEVLHGLVLMNNNFFKQV